MTFYLKPPRGSLNLHLLEECVKERLKFYHQHNQQLGNLDFQYLVEDSALDRTGHYFLRLAAYTNKSFRNIFLQNEMYLLENRLSSYSLYELKCFLKRFKRQSQENLKDDAISEILRKLYITFIIISTKMLVNSYMEHLFNYEHSVLQNCQKFTLYVPFQYCYSLIRLRAVNLWHGKAEITCLHWKKLLLSLYETYLIVLLKEMRYSRNVEYTLEDVRIQTVLNLVGKYNYRSSEKNCFKNKFNMENIKIESKLFPLCMLNLYQILEQKNRLAHNDRFDFSLFLKGIGTEMVDSLRFWETAYSKQHSSCSRCSHDWLKNEKRYIYGIRHLYGLEGSRKNYQTRSCNFLQEKSVGIREDGGCPFKHFDDFSLRKILITVLPNGQDDVEVIIKERKDPNKSCQLLYHHMYKQGTSCENIVVTSVQSPVHYYMSLKENINKSVR